jgi:hypothetical protein
MVHDNHFVSGGVRLDKGTREMGNEAGSFVAGADDDADWMLLGLIFGWGGKKGQPSEEPQIVHYLYQGDQTKNNKQQFEPGNAQIRFSHKRSTKVQI